MAKTQASEAPLSVRLEYDQIVIRVGIDTLAFCAENGEAFQEYNEATGKYERLYRVENARQFADDVVLALNKEEEDGTTPVHTLLDKAIEAAADNGSLGLYE